MTSFEEQEFLCSQILAEAGESWHLYTSEDHEVLFTCEGEFQIAMNIMGIAARLFPGLRIFTFEWMSNHLHMMLAGKEREITASFDLIRESLRKQLTLWGRPSALSAFKANLRRVETLEDARNVIVYDNRNGYLVNPATSPYTYPWGANRYYFNTDAQKRYGQCSKKMTVGDIRNSIRSRLADKIDPLMSLDGYACPMCFCDIKGGERLFRDARHYFFAVARNVEAHKSVAAEVGERVFYTDDELFAAVSAMARDRFGSRQLKLLPAAAKVEVARMMRFEYNAGNKQIQRMLRLDASVVGTLFPATANGK